VESFSSTYATPGWQRAQAQRSLNEAQARFTGRSGSQAFGSSYAEGRGGFQGRLTDRSGGGRMIEGELIARSSGGPSRFQPGDRVFHLKFGYGDVVAADGNKLTVQFDKAGEKKVVDSFVEAA
jgi:DNA helicase-2/ATP-dependent DNA helicase PcrA